jgi:hypothetical protein
MEQCIRIDIFTFTDEYWNIPQMFNELKPIYIKSENTNFKHKFGIIIYNTIEKINEYIVKCILENKLHNNIYKNEKNLGIFHEEFKIINNITEFNDFYEKYLYKAKNHEFSYFLYQIPIISSYYHNCNLLISINDMNQEDKILAKEYNEKEEDDLMLYLMKNMIKDMLNKIYLYPEDEEIINLIKFIISPSM